MIDMLITIDEEVYAVGRKLHEFNNVIPTIIGIYYCNGNEQVLDARRSDYGTHGYEIVAKIGEDRYYIFIPFHRVAKIKAKSF